MLLSIIIVTYKKLDIVINCLDSIEKYNDIGKKLEVIVVDNSPDNTIVEFINKEYPDVKTIKSANNGFGAGNNKGFKASSGKYTLFLNPDTILIESIFEFAIRKFEENPKLGIFGLKLLDASYNSNMSFFFIDKYGLLWGQILKFCNKFDLFFSSLMFTSGANIFIDSSVFVESGMFDENIFMYSEEKDLTKRVKYLGKQINYFPSKKMIHLEGKTTQGSLNTEQYRLDSLKYYCEKYSLSFTKRLKSEMFSNRVKLLINKLLNKPTNHINKKLQILEKNLANKLTYKRGK